MNKNSFLHFYFVLFVFRMQRYEDKTVIGVDRLRTKLPKMRFLFLALIVEELFWRVPRSFLEHSGEMLWVFKSQLFSHIVDGLAAKDEVLGASDDKVSDVVFRAFAKKLPDDFTKIAW